MRSYMEIYTELLSMMRGVHSLGEHPIGGTYIEYPGNGFNRICLYEYDQAPQDTFSLLIFAGDTCKQARGLFKHFSYEKAMCLEKAGWVIKSHFHFSWQKKNILFTSGDKDLPLGEYIDYWRSALAEGFIRKYNKNEFKLLLKRMSDAKVMNARDISDFYEYFKIHKYQSAITCPGIINRKSFSKEKLNGNLKILSSELQEELDFLKNIY